VLNRKSLVDEKNWTVVSDDSVFHFNTFHEALAWQTKVNGSLMTTSFYLTDYIVNH
jgi:hypothetical protein